MANIQNVKQTLPTIQDLMEESALAEREKDNVLLFLLNQEPPASWIKLHPTAKVKKNGVDVPVRYIPIERVYFLLHKVYGGYSVDIKGSKLVANSIEVTVRVTVKNPITEKEEFQDGIGAVPLQTDKGAGATEFDKIKSNAVQIGAPAAESFAIKDACEKFGKIFGRDLNVGDVDYTGFLKEEKIDDRMIVVRPSKEWYQLVQNLKDGQTLTDILKKVNLTEEQQDQIVEDSI